MESPIDTGEDFFVHPSRLRALSGTFADQQGIPANLAGGLDGAATVDTGDPSVDSAVREDVSQYTSLLRQLAEAIAQNAQDLSEVAANYEATDQPVGGAFNAIAGDIPGTV